MVQKLPRTRRLRSTSQPCRDVTPHHSTDLLQNPSSSNKSSSPALSSLPARSRIPLTSLYGLESTRARQDASAPPHPRYAAVRVSTMSPTAAAAIAATNPPTHPFIPIYIYNQHKVYIRVNGAVSSTGEGRICAADQPRADTATGGGRVGFSERVVAGAAYGAEGGTGVYGVPVGERAGVV